MRKTPLKQVKLSFAASAEQRLAITGRPCLVCGSYELVDPAHLIDRSLLGEGQDDPRAVVPLCRWRCHREYDEHALDLVPYLETKAWRGHLAFAVERYGLLRTLERVSNCRWIPNEVQFP